MTNPNPVVDPTPAPTPIVPGQLAADVEKLKDIITSLNQTISDLSAENDRLKAGQTPDPVTTPAPVEPVPQTEFLTPEDTDAYEWLHNFVQANPGTTINTDNIQQPEPGQQPVIPGSDQGIVATSAAAPATLPHA